jgi:hypothetical protein
VNTPLFVAGLLALVAAAVHGVAGELLVVRKLFHEPVPPTRLGGPRMTRAMVHATWHITTFAFLAAGAGMVVSAAVLDGDAAKGIAISSAAAFTGFAAIAAGLGTAQGSPRALLRHPGPIVLSGAAALAWWGAV